MNRTPYDYLIFRPWKIFLFLTLSVSIRTFGADSNQNLTFYRVLHASPDNIVSALFMPSNPTEIRAAQASKTPAKNPPSRLLKFFVIKSKIIRNDSVYLEIAPSVALPRDFDLSTAPVKVRLRKKSEFKNTFVFETQIQVTENKYVDGEISVSPSTAGSLLVLTVQKSNLNSTLIKSFSRVSKILGLTASSEEEAIESDKSKN